MSRAEQRKNSRSSKLARSWQLQEAKARLSELVRLAKAEGPQLITRQGKREVVVLPVEEYERLTSSTRPIRSIVQFFAESPLRGIELDLKRGQDKGRPVDL